MVVSHRCEGYEHPMHRHPWLFKCSWGQDILAGRGFHCTLQIQCQPPPRTHRLPGVCACRQPAPSITHPACMQGICCHPTTPPPPPSVRTCTGRPDYIYWLHSGGIGHDHHSVHWEVEVAIAQQCAHACTHSHNAARMCVIARTYIVFGRTADATHSRTPPRAP